MKTDVKTVKTDANQRFDQLYARLLMPKTDKQNSEFLANKATLKLI